MRLLPNSIRRRLPPLYATEHIPPEDKVAVVKFFTADSAWTLYGIEYDGHDRFFGFVIGPHAEWGYFSLRELALARGPYGLPVERDIWFSPKPMRLAEPKYFS